MDRRAGALVNRHAAQIALDVLGPGVARLSAQAMLRVSRPTVRATAIRLRMAALNATHTTSPGAARALRTDSRMAVSTARWISSGSFSPPPG